jgi:cellulose biosynthesis protein BcsQ
MLSVFQLHEMEAIAVELERKSYAVLTLDADTNSILNAEENLALNSWEDEIIEKFSEIIEEEKIIEETIPELEKIEILPEEIKEIGEEEVEIPVPKKSKKKREIKDV